MLEALVVVALAALVGYGIHRLPDSPAQPGDGTLFRAAVRGLWIFIALMSVTLVAAWLSHR